MRLRRGSLVNDARAAVPDRVPWGVPLVLTALLSACGGGAARLADVTDAAARDASAMDAPPSPAAAWEAAGFTVTAGSYSAVDLSACCAEGASCYANNPASPYLAVRLPPGAGQRAANPAVFPDAQGRSAAFRLRRDEVVVLLGPTPPAAAYVGYTPYVYDRAGSGPGGRAVVFASVSDTLNHLGLARGGAAFGRRVALVLTADADAESRAVSALRAMGLGDESIFRLPWVVTGGAPARPLVYGLAAEADTFSLLTRVALPTDPAALAAWQAAPGVAVLRLTPREALAGAAPAPFPVRTPVAAPEPTALAQAVDDLEAAIRAAERSALPPSEVRIADAAPDPIACLSEPRNCNGDNRDTPYPTSLPFLFPDDNDALVVFGVNHAATGRSTYSSFGVYTVDHLLGVRSVANPTYAGSAAVYLPSHPERDRLYAWKIARSCGADPNCTEVPAAACPQGIADGAASFLMLRHYVDPATGTRPVWTGLVPDRALRIRRR